MESSEVQRLIETGSELKLKMDTCISSIKDLAGPINGLAVDIGHLREVIGRTDEDGTPLCYTPRSWEKKLEAIIARFDTIAEPLSTIAVIQGETINLINKIDRRLEKAALEEERWKSQVVTAFGQVTEIQKTVSETSKGVNDMLPRVQESHGFVIKWKYGILPAVIAAVSSVIAGVYALLKLLSGGPPTTP